MKRVGLMWCAGVMILMMVVVQAQNSHGPRGLATLGQTIQTPDSAFRKPWPRSVYGPQSINLKTRRDLTKNGTYAFESTHYRYISNQKIEPRMVKRFAVLFETTHSYVLSLPLNASAHYRQSSDKYLVYLFGDLDSYHRSGGPVGSSGVYMPRTGAVMVPLPVLGVRWNGKKWVIEKGDGNNVLSHELAHQLTMGTRFGAWYIEGSAEYVATTRYTHGMYHAGTNNKKRVFNYIKSKDGIDGGTGRRLGRRIKTLRVESLMHLPYRQFAGAGANHNYGMGLLLTYYLYHEDGRRDGAAIKRYIKARQQGQSEKAAQVELLGGRSYAQLQESFRKFCASGGVTLLFPKGR